MKITRKCDFLDENLKTVSDLNFTKQNEIDRLRTALIIQVSRTRQYQEKIEVILHATREALRDNLPPLVAIFAINSIANEVKASEKDLETAKKLVDKTL